RGLRRTGLGPYRPPEGDGAGRPASCQRLRHSRRGDGSRAGVLPEAQSRHRNPAGGERSLTVAAFYIDHDVSTHVVHHLETMGHEARTSRALANESAADYQQLLTSTELGLILVTHNLKDFRLLHGAWLSWSTAWRLPQSHGGIVVLPHGPAMDSAERLDAMV